MANDLQVTISASVRGLVEGLQQAASAVKANTSAMEGTFGSLAKSFDGVKAPFLAFAGLLGGGALFKTAVGDVTSFTKETNILARSIGSSTEYASGLHVALDRLGIGAEQYTEAIFKVQEALREQEGTLIANGVATRNARGEMLGIQEIMQNGLARIKEMKEGYDANALSMRLFGESARNLAPLMQLSAARIEDGAKAAKELGLIITREGVTSVLTYGQAINSMKSVFEALSVRVGQALVPELTRLAQAFMGVAPYLVDVFGAALKILTALLNSTTLQVLAAAAVFRGPLFSSVAAAKTAVLGFVESLKMQYALGVAESIRNTNALAKTMGASTEAARQLGLMAGPTLGDKLKVMGSMLSGLISPQMLFVAGIAAGGIALERYMTAESRAAREMRDLSSALRQSTFDYVALSAEAQKLTSVTVANGYSTQQAREAKDRLALVITQLNNVYPGFNKFLSDEAGKHRTIAEAIAAANAERKRELEAKLAQAQARLEEIERERRAQVAATEEIAQQRRAQQAVAPSPAGLDVFAKGIDALRTKWTNAKIGDWDKAWTDQKAAVDDLANSIKVLSGDIDSIKLGKSFIDASSQGRATVWQQELDRVKALEENWFTWSDKREMEFWGSKLKLTQAGTAEQGAVLAKWNVARKAYAQAAHDATTQDYDYQASKDKFNAEERIRLAKLTVTEEIRLHGEGSKDVVAARKKLLELEREVQRDRLAAIRDEQAGERELALKQIEDRRQELELLVEVGRMSAEQEIELARDLAQRKYQIEHAGFQAQLKDEELNNAQRQEIYNRDKMAYQVFQNDLKQIALETARSQQQLAEKFISPFVSSFQQGLQKMLSGQITFTQAIDGLWKITFNAITEGVAQLVSDWLAQGLKMLGAWIANKTTELLFHKSVETAKAATTVTTANTAVAANAAQAGSAAAASAASTPVTGWMIALPAMAAVVMGVLALRSMVGSAAGGWDIGNENPIGQLHRREMVLPSKYAEGFRGIIDNLGNVSGGGGAGTVNINLQALDAVGLDRLLMNRRSTIIKIAQEAARTNRFKRT